MFGKRNFPGRSLKIMPSLIGDQPRNPEPAPWDEEPDEDWEDEDEEYDDEE